MFTQSIPLLFIFAALFAISVQPVLASDDDDNNQNLLGQANQGQAIQQQEEDDQEPIPVEPDQGPGNTPNAALLAQQNRAESNQVGGIGGGNINQQAQGSVNEQLCSTIGGIGNRQCAQQATPGAQNLQDCTAIAGLGTANCVQSEAGDGT